MNNISNTGIKNYLDFFNSNCLVKKDAVAVKYQQQSLTYEMLGEKVNQLANYLLRIGVEPGTLIGISAERSLEMILSMLAIHKIGAAYVPLDTAYPEDRINYMIKDSGLELILSDHDTTLNLPDRKIETINISRLSAEIEQESSDSPLVDIKPDDLAYVIYTSGSTGYPKGVMITHSNLVNFTRLVPKVLDMFDDDIYLQTASITYALSVRQIFVPLSHGVKLVIANPMAIQDPIELFKLIKDEKISLVDFVPSHWRSCNVILNEMNETDRADLLNNNLRRIVTVGESLLPDLPSDWKNKFNHDAQIVNIFGQTETTGIITNFKVTENNLNISSVVPIGEPIPDTNVHILDPENLSPVKNGEVGELCISNPCVGKGYLNDPGLTESKFVHNKIGNSNYPLYRTGDFARLSVNGSIEYLGRSDQQVKIRGIRVELGEIESVILRKSAVKNVALVPQTRTNLGTFLVAFLSAKENQVINADDLKIFVKDNLPTHMIPVSFIILDELPRNPNGKIDRKKLMEYKVPANEIDLSEDSSLSETEQKLVSIWKKLLETNSVKKTDNFFDDLGGDSLLAVHIFLEIEKEFGKRMAISNLYRAPTIETLSGLVDESGVGQEFHSLVPIRPGGTNYPLFIVHGAGGNILIYRDLSKHLLDNMPIYGLQSYGLEGDKPRLNTIEEMADSYIEEMKKIQPSGPYYICGYCMGGTISLQIAQQLKSNGDSVAFIAMMETYNWSQLPQRSFYDKAKFAGEKIIYHWKNLVSLSSNGRKFFLIGKVNDLKDRMKIWHVKLRSKFGINKNGKSDSITKQSEIWKLNDEAAFKYKADFYNDRLTVFLPKEKYSVHSVPEAIWNTEHAKEVDSEVLPSYPAGMLVEPFVKELAEKLNTRIRQNEG